MTSAAIASGIRRRIGHQLVLKGVISEKQLDDALQIQGSEHPLVRRHIGSILVDEFGADHHEVMHTVAREYAFRALNGNTEFNAQRYEKIRSLMKELPEELAEALVKKQVIPFEQVGNTLVLAAADPADTQLGNLIQKLPCKQHELVYCRLETMKAVIAEVYEKKNEYLRLLEDITYEDPLTSEGQGLDEEELDAEINQSMLNSLVEGMLMEAVRCDVSDVHIIPGSGNKTDIYFRLDGKLQRWHTQSGIKPEAMAAVIKDKSRNVDRFERDSSQDGFIQREIDGCQIRFRVSIMPVVGQEFDRKFESVVIRVLDDRKVITDLNLLGLQNKAYEDFCKAIRKPSGIVIITGPTGSGKSTTLVAALYSVVNPTVNVLTVEEPVEYLIKGVRQLKISPKMTFDNAVRGILRHDPDIVLVGEIRDLLTAEIAIKLANTGHLTFSTLHTNDAPSAVARLFKMGVEPFLIANAVNLVMAQRLVRRLCNYCKEPIEDLNVNVPLGLGFSHDEIEQTTFYRPVGCERCNSGFKGRVAIHEALYFDRNIRNIIFESGAEIDEDRIRRQALANGMLTLRASGRERIKAGITTLEEIMATTIEE